jgi:AAA domain (dynein-related subfamily)/CbbQ/NirQ/NorQ C-terminal
MYLYFDADTLKLIAVMPSNRGRTAKNHTLSNFHGAELSISYVPNADTDSFTSALDAKNYVVANGPGESEEDHEVCAGLRDMLRAMKSVLTEAGAGIDPQPYARSITSIEQSLERFDEMVAEGLGDDLEDEWNPEAAEIINRLRRTVNSIMNDRGYGWFHKGYAGITAKPAAAPAAEKEEEKVEHVDDGSYGFARMAGDRPSLSVVGAEEAAENEEHGVFYPKPDATYIINRPIENLFSILDESSKKCPQNVRLIGPHGCGKTELAIQFAARTKRPLLIMDCANLREARDWFGYKSAKDGTVFWHESQFVRAVQAGNHVILLDELNRANPNLLNTLMPILDARRFTYLEERGDKIIVGPRTVFFASMNEGASYTGTSTLDRAIRDRFPRHVELTYLGETDETRLLQSRTGINKDIASRLVQMANKIRQDATGLSATLTESLSTRQLLAAAHDFALGGVETLTFTIINHFSPDGDDESERAKVQSLIQGKFGDLMAAEAAAASKGA